MNVRSGDRVLLLDVENGERFLVHLDGGGARKEKGLGVFDPGRLQGMAYGRVTVVGAKKVCLLRPTAADLAKTLRRQAQIITPKDVARITYELAVRPGERVFESGIGSGASSLALAEAVGPEGELVVQELREEFGRFALDNLDRAGLGDRVSVHLGDLTQGLSPGVSGPFDAALLDQPEPWATLPFVIPALAPGARIAIYCPQVSQMEKSVRALLANGFLDVRALETIEREWVIQERGSRPAHEMLGHTGFLVFGRFPGLA